MSDLVSRIRAILGPRGATEQKMFGGVCFLLNGNMVAGSMNNGSLLARVDKERHASLAARPHASGMVHNNRAMTGFIIVEAAGFAADKDLEFWLGEAASYVSGLPPKSKKPPARKSIAKKARS